MGVEKTIISPGNGKDSPEPGRTITVEYTGWLYDESAPGGKGEKFDSSVGRGDFVVQIGVGQVIRGWDEGIMGMTVGEKVTLLITSDYGYGSRGYTGHIPPNSTLVFDVLLKGVR